MSLRNFVIYVLLMLTISACSSNSTQQTSNTPTIPKTPTASQTSTQTPTITPSPTLTVTSTPELPVSLGTAFPYPVATIGPDNCNQVVNLANWGGVDPDVFFSPDGRYLLLGKPSGYTLYETSTMTQVYMKNARFGRRSFAFTADGSFLVFGDGGNIEVMDLSNGEIVNSIVVNGFGITISPDGQSIVSQDNDNLNIFELSSGKLQKILPIPISKGGGNDNTGIPVFSSDGELLAHQNNSGSAIIVYDLESGQRFRTFYPSHMSEKMKFSSDGTYIVSVGTSLSYESIEVWNIPMAKSIISYKTSSETFDTIDSFSITSNSVSVLLSSHRGFGQYKLEFLQWNISDGELIKDEIQTNETVSSQSLSPSGSLRAIGTKSGSISVLNVASGSRLVMIYALKSPITKLTFSPDGKLLAASSPNGIFKIWEVSTGNEKLSLSGFFETGYYSAITLDGKKLATSFLGGNSTNPGIFLWDITTGTLLKTLDQIGTSYLAFSPDGQLLATNARNDNYYNIVQIWDVNEGRIIKELDAGEYTIFSPDGKFLATNEFRKDIKLWDVETWELLGTYGNYENFPKFSPDGNHIVSIVDYGKQIHIFNIASGAKITIPDGSFRFDFLQGSSQLAVYTKDINIYDIKTGQLVRTIKLDSWDGYNMFVQMVNYPVENFVTTFGYNSETGGSVLKVYDTGSGEVLCKKLFPNIGNEGYMSYFTPDNKMFVTTADVWSKYPLSFWGVAP